MFWDCHVFKHIPQLKRIDIIERLSIANEAYISSLPSSLSWTLEIISVTFILNNLFKFIPRFLWFCINGVQHFLMFSCFRSYCEYWLASPFHFSLTWNFSHKQFVTCSKVGSMTHLCFYNCALSSFLWDKGGRLREPLNSTSKGTLN